MILKSIGAYAIRSGDTEQPLLADSQETLNKVMALKWIAEWKPTDKDGGADIVREALLDERWGDAVIAWMEATSRCARP